MASVFERLRTIALTVQSSSYEEDPIPIARSRSLLLPEKPNRIVQASEDKSETPQCVEESGMIFEKRRLSKRDISRQLLAKHPKSTRDDPNKSRILRGFRTSTKLDTCFIETVDDFAVNSRSGVIPFIFSRPVESLSARQDSSENTSRFGSSSDESIPPSSTNLGIGPAPCFLVSQSTDEEQAEVDRAVEQHLSCYLPSSWSIELNNNEQLDTGSLVSSSSVIRSSSYNIDSSRMGSLENKEEGACSENFQISKDQAEADRQPTVPMIRLESVKLVKPRGSNIDDVDECIPSEQLEKVKPKNPISNDKVNIKAWNDNDVVVTSYGDKMRVLPQLQCSDTLSNYTPSLSLLPSIRSPQIPEDEQADDLTPSKLERLDTDDNKLALVGSEDCSETEYTEKEYMQYMLSLFENREWVQAEDLCPISSLGSLGRGAGGGVTGVFHIPTCMIYALKATSQWSEIDTFVILKEALGDQRTLQLMNLYGLFEDINSNEKALVLEYMDLGSLHDHFLSKEKRCTEKQVRHIARETLLGLHQLHSFETPIIHRDIKPHNILIESGGSIRVADYGLLYSLRDKTQYCTDLAGTSKYFSPERHNGKFSMPSDIWALGVTLLECFLGKTLDPRDLEDVKVAGGQVHPLELHNDSDIPLSADALDFLNCCLVSSPSERWDAKMLLEHPFLQPPYPDKTDIFVSKRKMAGNETLLREILEIIQSFIRMNMEGEVSQKDIWANVKGITHEKRLSNIVRWTGFTKPQIEEYVMQLYNERTNPRSRY